jgi:hypothetical protein
MVDTTKRQPSVDSAQAADDLIRPFRDGYGGMAEGLENAVASGLDDARADERDGLLNRLDEALEAAGLDIRTAHEIRGYVREDEG